jgi:hypothetical protein
VRLHITKGRTTHVLEACLTPEGGRSYKIDGKLKTGTQVKVGCVPARIARNKPRVCARLCSSCYYMLPAVSCCAVLCCVVQDFLKARGIVIDSTTVIQQAAVTGLSDSNSECQAVLRRHLAFSV